VNRFRDTGTLHRVASDMRKGVNAWTRWAFSTFNITLFFFLFSDFNIVYFLTKRTCVRNGLRNFSITLYLWWLRSTSVFVTM
jgi:hypothetical protein